MTLVEALARLRATHEFQVLLEAANEKRPFLLPFDPKETLEKNTTNLVYRSGQVNGFELLFNFLKGSK